MANTKIVFLGTEKSQTENHELLCYSNDKNEIFISIEMEGYESSFICLDKSTAIKLHRELKKHISFLNESEVFNG